MPRIVILAFCWILLVLSAGACDGENTRSASPTPAASPTPEGSPTPVASPTPGPPPVAGPVNKSMDLIRDQIANNSGHVKLQNLRLADNLTFEDVEGVKSFDCENVIFDGDFLVVDDYPDATFNLFNCTFKGTAFFSYVVVKEMNIHGSLFEKGVDLDSLTAASFVLANSRVRGNAQLRGMRVGSFRLVGNTVDGTVDLTGTQFENVNSNSLDPIEAKGSIRISWSQFGDKWLKDAIESALLFDESKDTHLQNVLVSLQQWKENFQRLGYQRDVSEVNYQIIELRRQYFMRPSQADWWAAYLLSLPNRYGTRPYRPLKVGLLVIVLFAVLYTITDPFVPQKEEPKRPKRPLVVFALLYSIDTFIPIFSVARIREWGWELAPSYRYVELGERLLGLVLSGLAAYSISYYVL